LKYIFSLFLFFTTLSGQNITEFSFEGNRRTQTRTLLRIADISIGDTLTGSLLSNAQIELMRSNLFVSAEVSSDTTGLVSIVVSERWTIIPYFNLAGNSENKGLSSIYSIQAGLYDVNFLGTFSTIGGGYHYFRGTHNGNIYGGKENISDLRLNIFGSLSLVKGVNAWYDPYGSPEAAFINDRVAAKIKVEFPLSTDDLFLGVTLSGATDTLHEELNDLNFEELNRENGYRFDESYNTFAPSLSLRYSGFRYNRFTYEGFGAKGGYSIGFQDGDGSNYNVFSLGAQWYKLLPLESNVAINFTTALTTGKGPTDHFYLGGESGVRGFNTSEFRGRTFMKLNSEYRLPSLNTNWIVLQHIFFLDMATVASETNAIDQATALYGAGIGIRILSPKIYSFMIRVDYGWGWGPYRRNQLYFGTSHFFLPF